MRRAPFTPLLAWLGVAVVLWPPTLPAAPPEIVVEAADGGRIPLRPEDTAGLAARPLVRTRERLHARFKREVVFLYRLAVAPGARLTGRHHVTGRPLRLTLYQISKKDDSPRNLRVVASGFYATGETAAFGTVVQPFKEHVYLVTAEAAESPARLNPHLAYMSSQGDQIVLKGFSTNWNMSVLRFHLAEKAPGPGGEVEFAKDADWLIDNLISPEWIVSIRLGND